MAELPQDFLELLNRYPSPHNGQPMRIEKSDHDFIIYFDTSRGLSATPISYLFSFVTIGLFVHYVELCAKALGHNIEVQPKLPKVGDMAADTSLECARFTIELNTNEPDTVLGNAITHRHTSRKKYTDGLSEPQKLKLEMMAQTYNMKTAFLEKAAAQQAIWLNQRAVFDDMFDDAVRNELKKWIRFDLKEKQEKKDGLAYDCMQLDGNALKFIFSNYKLLRAPGISWVLKQYYLRTMKDNSDVGYVLAPFVTEEQAYQIGRYIIDAWLDLSKENFYLHPFGTIVSNDQAHKDFCQIAGITDESRDSKYIVFIFRAGKSSEPIMSERLDIESHLYKEKNNV